VDTQAGGGAGTGEVVVKGVSSRRVCTAAVLAAVVYGCWAGCARRVAEIHRLGDGAVVVAFGDSLTAGTGAEEGSSYPEVLGGLLGVRVVNAGVPGETSSEGLGRLPHVLDLYKPDLVIICHGGNDMLQGRDLEEVERNVTAMVKMAQLAGADVVLVGVPAPGLILRTAPFYRRVARRCGVPIEDRILAEVLSRGGLKSDAIHPNSEGYRRMATAVAALIRRAGG